MFSICWQQVVINQSQAAQISLLISLLVLATLTSPSVTAVGSLQQLPACMLVGVLDLEAARQSEKGQVVLAAALGCQTDPASCTGLLTVGWEFVSLKSMRWYL